MKKTSYLLFTLLFALPISAVALMEEQTRLIEHVKESIANAEYGISKLNSDIMAIEGSSSPKVRHFLNNLCSLPKTHYLEIGLLKGSTLVSSLYRNQRSILSATAIDIWAVNDGNELDFHRNRVQFLPYNRLDVYKEDCFKMKLSVFRDPITIYFYDGEHTKKDHEMAFTYYDTVLSDLFIAVVDDWNWESVSSGTRAAFEKLHYNILFEQALPARYTGDVENWWNGLYVAVISKTQKP